ncbi:INO80 complex subunit E [Trichinella zimbabwensis]|uniref:INO80 complex subunit E n=2 Tax=Trichinella TaxID=6333 RepID=A0A0V1MJI6_9BILA|nr:INO80 complex subunit E [Trichinella zimbabwensis]KRZ72033.1 INO80 complex subunit E [Trichinella papuae]
MAKKPSTSCNHAVDEKADDAEPQETAKEKYRKLKRRFKMLVFENEGYHEELRNLQRRLLKLTRDKNFIMERLLYFERPSDSSDDSDVTVEKPKKRKRSKNVDGDDEKKNGAKERKSLACSPTVCQDSENAKVDKLPDLVPTEANKKRQSVPKVITAENCLSHTDAATKKKNSI